MSYHYPPFERPSGCNIVHARGMYRVIEEVQLMKMGDKENIDVAKHIARYTEEVKDTTPQGDINRSSAELGVRYKGFDIVDHFNGFMYAAITFWHYVKAKSGEALFDRIPDLNQPVRPFKLVQRLYNVVDEKTAFDIESDLEEFLREA